MLYLLQAAKCLRKHLGVYEISMLDKGMICANRFVQRIWPVRSDLEEVSVGNVKGT